MSLYKNIFCLVLLVLNICALVSSDGVSLTVSDSADKLKNIPSLSPAAAFLDSSSVFKPGVNSIFSLNLLSSFPDDLEISNYCSDLLHIFGQRYVAYVNCLVPAARPVKVCQNCFSTYGSLKDTYMNISSDQMGPGNVSCKDSLLRSDRLMLVYLLYSNLEDIWSKSNCDNCITEGFRNLTNDMLYFMTTLNQTLTCFEKYQQGNHTELCKNCKSTYRDLNELYGRKEKNQTMCIDIEDAVCGQQRQRFIPLLF